MGKVRKINRDDGKGSSSSSLKKTKKPNSANPDRPNKVAVGSRMRTKATVKRLQMYKGGKAIRNKQGKIVQAAEFQSSVKSGEVARVEPNRKWFGNTKVISQTALQTFQEEMGKAMKNPYKVVMQQSKLPLSLLNDRKATNRVHLLDTESFQNTFGKKAHRKRPVLATTDLGALVAAAEEKSESYQKDKDMALIENCEIVEKEEVRDPKFQKGQSKRIWNELYKVIDSSDVVIQVLDARDPMGTRSPHIEEFMTKEKKNKHLFFVLNKCDLVPTWVTRKWVALLSAEHPTLAFHASVTNPFGKGALIQLLRQFGKLHQDKKNISVGFIGYPNVGKSSIINTLKKKKVCKTAPIPGETKVWQYITFMRRIYLIDCPGVVYPTGDTETEIVLKGIVRIENLKEPSEHIAEVLKRVKKDYLVRTYKVETWTDTDDFLDQLCRKTGRLLKGGEPDINTASKMILSDFQRGRLPYFVAPPTETTKDKSDDKTESSTEKVFAKVAQRSGTSSSKEGEAAAAAEGAIKIKQNFKSVEMTAEFNDEDKGDEVEEEEEDEEEIEEDEEEEDEDEGEIEEKEEGEGEEECEGEEVEMDEEDLGEEEEEGTNSESIENDVNHPKTRHVKFDFGTTTTEDDDDEEEDTYEDFEAINSSEQPGSGSDTTTSTEKLTTCDAFSKARKKANLKRKQPRQECEFSSENTNTEADVGEDESEDEEEVEEDGESENTNGLNAGASSSKKKYSSDDDVASDLADSLTPEERAFLGLTSGVVGGDEDEDEDEDDSIIAKQMTPVSGKNFKVFSSPQVMVVEADPEDPGPTKKRKMTAAERLKRKLVDKIDKKHKKTPRMTTNKKKTGDRYYESANVKNRKRNTQTPFGT